MIRKKISRLILKLAGWKSVLTTEEPDKSILCVAPHTSNWDFIIGKLFYWSIDRKTSFLIKKSWFAFPFGIMFRAMNGIPVDRSRNNSVVQQMVEEFAKREKMHLAITPEGTRQLNKRWKLGFYHIAVGAKVPIQLAYINYKNKEMGIKEVFFPTGDEKTDLQHIYDYYKKNGVAKFPERFAVPSPPAP